MEEKRKSRTISPQDFFSILQLEYLSYLVRSKIFDEPFVQKHKEFCEKKKATIEFLAKKDDKSCIFNNEKVLKKYLDEFFNETGFPNFKYRDEYQKQNTGFYDKKYYFRQGVVVLFEGEEFIVDKNCCDFENTINKIVIRKGKKYKKVDVSCVTRKDYLKLV